VHPFFSPLTPWEASVLLTTLTVGGSDQVGVFAHLAPEPRGRVQEKAQALLAIPAEKRVPLMVRELRELFAARGRRGVERVDPSWIVHYLHGESPRVVATILVGLPPPLVRSVLKRLPQALRKTLPPKDEIAQIAPSVADAVRLLFEARFHPMPTSLASPMRFRDVLHLERLELYHLTRDLGLIELGQAFVAVGRMALLELCRRLPRERAQELIRAVRVASTVDAPDPKSAQRFLSRVVMNFEDTEEFLQKAGLWRLAKGCLLEDEAARLSLAQRLPRKAGQLLGSYIQKAQAWEELTPEVLGRLQDSILVRVVMLSRTGKISAPWAQTPMGYHDAAAAQAAIEAATQRQPSGNTDEMLANLGPETPARPKDD
jgi:hypothetical protein